MSYSKTYPIKIFNRLLCFLIGLSLHVLFLSKPAIAAEVDSFTLRHHPIQETTNLLNTVVNEKLQLSVELANKRARRLQRRLHPKTRRPMFPLKQGWTFCNEKMLVKAVKQQLAGPVVGKLESWVENNEQIPKINTPFVDSIYRDFTLEETPMLAASERMASLVLVNNVLIGSDKFGHFFTEGRTYFERMHEKKESLDEVMTFGERTEIVIFGSITTGVFSYADLVANLNGLRFWSALLGQFEDPLTGQFEQPFVSCRGRTWQLNRSFSWEAYIDPAWDEAINCSLFRNETLLHKVKNRLPAMERCAMASDDQEALIIKLKSDLRDKYGLLFDRLVNQTGHQVLPEAWQAYSLVEQYVESEKGQSKPKWVLKVIGSVGDKLKVISQ